MPGLAEVWRQVARDAEVARSAIGRVRSETQGLIRETEALVQAAAPSTLGSTPPASPGGIVDASGRPVRRTAINVGGIVAGPPSGEPALSSVGSGGGAGGGGGGGGGGGSRTVDERLRSIDGQHTASRAFVEASCRRVTLTIPGRATGFDREVDAWDCGELGVFLDGDGVLDTVSAQSSGGGGGGQRSPGRDPFSARRRSPYAAVSGVGGSGVGAFENTTLDNVSGGLSSPGVEGRLDRTNRTLESIDRKLDGDAGLGLRVGGFV